MVDSMHALCKPGVRMNFASDLPDDYAVQTNQEGVQTLLKHLLMNAIQHTDHGVITLSCSENGDMVRTSVTDTGTGLPELLKQNVFTLLNDENTYIQNESPGLGLSICKAIVDAAHGHIGADSKTGEGTCFWHWLPVKCHS